MKEKYYEFTSLILMGIILIILGITLLIGKNITYQYLINIIVTILLITSIRQFCRFIFRKLNKKEETKTFISYIFHIIVCIILILFPNIALGIAPFLFSIYLTLIGITQLIMCILEIKNKELISFKYIIIGIFCFSIAIPILTSPVTNINSFLNYVSTYSILLGTSMHLEAISRILSKKTKNQLKRRIRITLPKIIEAIIPYSIMEEINRNLALDKKQIYTFDNKKESIDLDILVHTSNRGANKMGHIDLCFEGMIISYGNYDEGSRICKETFGDGVLFMTSRKEDYINFCINNSKKTVFDFGITLSEKQKDAIRNRIEEIMKNSVEWNYKTDKLYNNGKSYAGKLYKNTKAKFYKFSKGKYHTYFVLGTNCCFLVDDIVGKCGMDIVSINGIITPGTYYDYLNRELKLKTSNVISKEIYNYKRKAKKENK